MKKEERRLEPTGTEVIFGSEEWDFFKKFLFSIACEPQTYFRSSLLSLRKIITKNNKNIFRRERSDDRKYVRGSQAP